MVKARKNILCLNQEEAMNFFMKSNMFLTYSYKMPTIMDENVLDREFKIVMIFASEMISQLKVKHPNSSIDDWKGYLVQRLSSMLQSYHTFSRVLLEDNDYITDNTILRMMADNLSITKFIYVDHDGDMRLLRHYMFLLDGSLTFLKLTDSMEDVDNLIKEARERTKKDVKYINEQIAKLPLYKENRDALDKFFKIDKRECNWKFRELSSKDGFRFHELYKKLEIAPKIVAYLEYLSQFAHGLGLYSLGTVASMQNIPFLLGMRNMLLGMLINTVYKLFSEYDLKEDDLLEALRTKLSRSEMEFLLELSNGNYGIVERQIV